MSLTDRAIDRIRELVQSGELPAGSRLPSEPHLAAQLGISRNLTREAVKALVLARVLEIRRGDGTYVTSLEPAVLLEGLGSAVELLQGDALQELTEVRRLFEPIATGLAASRISAAQLAAVEGHLAAMREACDDVELLNKHDAAFHRAVAEATGNKTSRACSKGFRAGLYGRVCGAAWSTAMRRNARWPSTRRSTRRWWRVTARWRRPLR